MLAAACHPAPARTTTRTPCLCRSSNISSSGSSRARCLCGMGLLQQLNLLGRWGNMAPWVWLLGAQLARVCLGQQVSLEGNTALVLKGSLSSKLLEWQQALLRQQLEALVLGLKTGGEMMTSRTCG